MRTRVTHTIEMFGAQATIYVAGILDEAHVFPLNRICGELPACISTLRMDLHDVEKISSSTISAVRTILQTWREARNGSFRLLLASDHMIAVYSEIAAKEGRTSMRDAAPHIVESVNPAHVAMFI